MKKKKSDLSFRVTYSSFFFLFNSSQILESLKLKTDYFGGCKIKFKPRKINQNKASSISVHLQSYLTEIRDLGFYPKYNGL